jgi:hypothetical protein
MGGPKGGKGKGDRDGKGGQHPLEGKSYKDAVQDVCNNTCLVTKDIDQRAVQLLDALQKAGKVDAAIQHLKTSLNGIETREKVQDWKKYSYKLLRDFDSELYNAYKEKAAGSRQRGATAKKEKATGFNTSAPSFTPGQWWTGKADVQQPQAFYPMGYPMMMMPQMMMPQQAPVAAGGPPPPPPSKAAETKTESKEASGPPSGQAPDPSPKTEADGPSTDAPKSEAR